MLGRNEHYNDPVRARNLADLDWWHWKNLTVERFEELARATSAEQFIGLFNRTISTWGYANEPSMMWGFQVPFFKEIFSGRGRLTIPQFKVLIEQLSAKNCFVEIFNYKYYKYPATNLSPMVDIIQAGFFGIIVDTVPKETFNNLLQSELAHQKYEYVWEGEPRNWFNIAILKCPKAQSEKATEKLSLDVLDEACRKGAMLFSFKHNPNLFKMLCQKIKKDTLNDIYGRLHFEGLLFEVNVERRFVQLNLQHEITANLMERLTEENLSKYLINTSVINEENLLKLLDKAPLLFFLSSWRGMNLEYLVPRMRENINFTPATLQQFEQHVQFMQNPEEAMVQHPQQFIEFVTKHIIRRLRDDNLVHPKKWLEILSKALKTLESSNNAERYRDSLLALRGRILLIINKGTSDQAWKDFEAISSVENIEAFLCQDIGETLLITAQQEIEQGNVFFCKARQLKALDFLYKAAEEQKVRNVDMAGHTISAKSSAGEVLTLPVYLNNFVSNYYRDEFNEVIEVKDHDESSIHLAEFERVKKDLKDQLPVLGAELFRGCLQRFDQYLDQRRLETQQNCFVFFANSLTDFEARESIFRTLRNTNTPWKQKIDYLESKMQSGELTKGWLTHRCQDLLKELHQIATIIHQNLPEPQQALRL